MNHDDDRLAGAFIGIFAALLIMSILGTLVVLVLA